MANLALFDLDLTLINVDSDHSWGQFIVEKGLVDAKVYADANDQFYQDYIAGTLDAVKYNEFVAAFLTTQTMANLHAFREEYLNKYIIPNMRPKGIEQINQHRAAGDTVLIISATNDFVVVPIAALFGIDAVHTLATRLEILNNRYTGKVSGKPNFQAGKIYHLKQFIEQQAQNGVHFEQLIAYSDSKNDIPLLEYADVAVCVSPDATLQAVAADKGWQVADWAF